MGIDFRRPRHIRGFKLGEVLIFDPGKALVEKTVSGTIAHITDGADDVPTKSLIVTIPPTLSGVSSVTETQTGRNLFDISTATNGQINGTNGVYYANANWQASDFFPVHGANLTLSWDTDSRNYYQVNLAFYDNAEHYVDGSNNRFANIYSKTFTIPNCAVYCRASWSISVGGSPAPRNNIRINLGSTDGGYTPYTSPTQYTASLGRTIYGGTADIVNGEGKENYNKGSMSSAYLSGLSSYIGYEASTYFFNNHPTIWVRNWNYQTAKIRQAGGIGCVCNYFPVSMHNTDIISTQNRIYFDVNGKGISSVSDFIAFVQNLEANNESLDIVYELNDTYSTDFTFTPITPTPETALGVNNFWNDYGNSEVTYYADPDLSPTQL